MIRKKTQVKCKKKGKILDGCIVNEETLASFDEFLAEPKFKYEGQKYPYGLIVIKEEKLEDDPDDRSHPNSKLNIVYYGSLYPERKFK